MPASRQECLRYLVMSETGRMSSHARRALVVIDVQNDYAGGNLPIEFPDLQTSLANIGKAIDAAQSASVPVVAVQSVLPAGAPLMAQGTFGAELHEVVRSRGWDHLVDKKFPGAFTGTGLGEWLRAHQLDTITVAGYMTHNCDFSTIVEAVHAGFSVEFLSDASGSVPYENRAGKASAEELHRVFTVVMQSRFAAVMSTEEWISILRTGAAPERDTIVGSNRRARAREAGDAEQYAGHSHP
jgi:nicotinamidase-related amidase